MRIYSFHKIQPSHTVLTYVHLFVFQDTIVFFKSSFLVIVFTFSLFILSSSYLAVSTSEAAFGSLECDLSYLILFCLSFTDKQLICSDLQFVLFIDSDHPVCKMFFRLLLIKICTSLTYQSIYFPCFRSIMLK